MIAGESVGPAIVNHFVREGRIQTENILVLLDLDDLVQVRSRRVPVPVRRGDADDAAVVVLLGRTAVDPGQDHHVAGIALEFPAELFDRLFGQQAHIPQKDVDFPVFCGIGKGAKGHAHRIPGARRQAQDRVSLIREDRARSLACCPRHLLGLDAHDDDLVGTFEAGLDCIGHAQHGGLAPDLVEHLGGLRTDALAVAGGQHDADAGIARNDLGTQLLQQGRYLLSSFAHGWCSPVR